MKKINADYSEEYLINTADEFFENCEDEKAVSILKELSYKGSAKAQYKLFSYYEEQGSKKEAYEWLVVSASQGYKKAVVTLYMEYKMGGKILNEEAKKIVAKAESLFKEEYK